MAELDMKRQSKDIGKAIIYTLFTICANNLKSMTIMMIVKCMKVHRIYCSKVTFTKPVAEFVLKAFVSGLSRAKWIKFQDAV